MNRRVDIDARFLVLALILACDTPGGCGEGTGFEGHRQYQHRTKLEGDEAWNAECHDTSTLIATTAGSPNTATCTNKHHRMHVEPVTKASNEEIGSLIFCQCVHDDGGAD